MKAELTVFDGGDCIGGSKIHLQVGDTGVFLDFGMNFKKHGMYFEEFLQPRTATRGLHDLLSLGVVPPFEGVYRGDAFIGPEHKTGLRPKVDAVFLSHAHADHVGHMGLLDPTIPVYCSHMTAIIVKATQDCGSSHLEGENVFVAPRAVCMDEAEPFLKKVKSTYAQRPYFMVDDGDFHEDTRAYWREMFVSEKTKAEKSFVLETKDLTLSGGVAGEIEFEAIPVDHSVYGATAYVFDLGGKKLCYTGDFRMHGWRPDVSAAFRDRLRELAPDYLVIEGTNVDSKKGNDTEVQQRASEEDVYRNCLRAVRDAAGDMVIADFGARNIERLLIFLKIAGETGRRLAVTAKDLFLLHAMSHADVDVKSALNDPNLFVYGKTKGRIEAWERVMRDLYGDKFVFATDVKTSLPDYIMAFSFWDIGELLSIEPRGGIYIYSTCEAFSEEMEIDVWRLGNWLARFNIEPVGLRFKKPGSTPGECEVEYVTGYHASGHISSRELVDFVDHVKPGAVIPVHTENPSMFAELLGRDVRIIKPAEGRSIEL